jgi:AcrR family transcriptional regulator
MVQKYKKSAEKAKKPRGRPRAFEPEAALGRALDTFRDAGYAATSLDELSEAMGINRPSLYGTFGDKRELFLKAYKRYRADAQERVAPAFAPGLSLRQTLEKVFAEVLNLYMSGENGPSGCLTVMTASSEGMADPEIRETVQQALKRTDEAFRQRFLLAIREGDLPANADVELYVQLVGATFHTLAVRSRARLPRNELLKIPARTVDLICNSKRGSR